MSSRVSNVSIIAPKLTAAYSIATGDHPSLSTLWLATIVSDRRKQKGQAGHGALHRITTGRT